MKRNLQLILGASAVSVLTLSAPAQDTFTSKTDDSKTMRSAQTSYDHLKESAKASDLIGMTVKNYQDEKLGKVSDLAVDVASGRIVQVIISSGGLLGMGGTLTPVPPGALHQDLAEKVVHLDMGVEKFNAAPRWETAKWDAETQSNRVSEVYGYYGQKPYFVRDEYATTNQEAASADALPRSMDGTINTAGGTQMETAHNVEVARNVEEQNNHLSTRNPDGTWKRVYYSNRNAANSSWSNLGSVQQSSKLIGTTVKNLQDEKIGAVNNFIVDLSAGRIVAVIISAGGYLGMAGELSAVPAASLKFNREQKAFQLDTSKEQLANSPHFKANEWPDFNQPGYAGGVYHAYHVEPYFNASATAQPDNTARNVRDRDSRALTPLDQGNSQADIDTTAQIRKEIMAADDLSVNAKNVKIITMNGRVTLRGPVNTAEEKRQIAEIANRLAPAGQVDNQLEASQNTNGN